MRRGSIRAVIGTRSAAYAPVADLGLLAIWDDGDDLHDEPRAPYATTRDVLVLRSAQSRAALLIGGYARTPEAQQLVASGWAHEIVADRAALRAAAPRIVVTGDDVEQARDPAAAAARLPSLAWRTTREALAAGHPVLVQVPRRGYVPSLACARDRTPARCVGLLRAARGVLGARRARLPVVRPSGRRLALPALPGTRAAVGRGRRRPHRRGAGSRVPGRHRCGRAAVTGCSRGVPAEPDLVVATPGAEPVAEGGYGAALLLDGWALLSRADLRAGVEALRRWLAAAALVRSDGTVVVGADSAVPGRAGAGAVGPRRASPPASSPSATNSGSRRRCGWPRSPASRPPSASCSAPRTCPTAPR